MNSETGGRTESAAAAEASPTGTLDSTLSGSAPVAPIAPLRQTGRYTAQNRGPEKHRLFRLRGEHSD